MNLPRSKTATIHRAIRLSRNHPETNVYVVIEQSDGDRDYQLALESDLDTFYAGCPVLGCAYNGRWDW